MAPAISREWRNQWLKEDGRRSIGGAIYKRKNSEFWQVRYKDQKGEIDTRIGGHIRSSSRPSDSFGIGSMHATRDVWRVLDQQATHVQRLGRLVSGEAFEAAVSERWQPPAECECAEISQAGIRRDWHYRISPPKRSRTTWRIGFNPGAEYTPNSDSNCAGGSNRQLRIRSSGSCRIF